MQQTNGRSCIRLSDLSVDILHIYYNFFKGCIMEVFLVSFSPSFSDVATVLVCLFPGTCFILSPYSYISM